MEVSYGYDSDGTATIFDKTLNQELVLTENKAQVIKGHQIVVNATGNEGRTFYSGQWWPTGKSERNPINALPLELTADVNLSVSLTFQYLASYSVRGEAGGTLKGYFLDKSDPEAWFPEEVPFDSPRRFFLDDKETFVFKAQPSEGYKLNAWYLNGELVQGESELTYKVVQPRTSIDVEVEFSKEVAEAKVTMVQPEATQGAMTAHYTDDAEKAVTDGMSVEKGVKVTFVVAPKEGYEMASWKVNDETKELESADPNQLTLTVEGDLEVEPVLKKVEAPAGCTVTLGEWSSAQGFFYAFYGSDMTTVTSGDVLPVGTVVSFQVDAEGDYELDYWLVDDVKSDDTSNPLVITLSKDVKVLPVMKKKEEPQPTQGVITMIQPKDDQGKEIGFLAASYYDDDLYEDIAVTDGMGVDLGTTITFLVTPEEGYEMDYWMINDARQELDSETPNQTIITVEGDLEVEPILKSTAAPVEKVRLSVQEEGVGGFAMVRYQTPGSTTWEKPAEGTNPTLDLPIGTKVRVLANISIDGATVAFTHNGNPVAADQLTNEELTYEFTLEAAADIKVIFTEGVIGFQIFYDCDKHATITGTADGEPFTSGDKLPLGARVELTVTPEDGYEVKDWLDDDFELIKGTEYQNPYTFTVDGSVNVFAEIQKKTTAFVKISYEGTGGYLETTYLEPNGSGNPLKIFGDKRIPLGSVVTVKAKFFMTGDYLVAYTNNGNPVPAEALTEDGLVYTFSAPIIGA